MYKLPLFETVALLLVLIYKLFLKLSFKLKSVLIELFTLL